MKKLTCVIIGLAFLSGCVSASKYKSKEGELAKLKDECAAQINAAANTMDGLKAELRQAGAKSASDDKQIAALQKSNKDLQDSLDANKGELTKKVSSLIKERDELSQKLSAGEQAALQFAQERDDAREANKTLLLEKEAKEKETLTLAQDRDKALEEKKAAEAAKEAEIARVKKNYEDLTASLKSEISNGEITITQLKGRLTVNMVDRILFASGQAEVKADGKKVLERIGTVLGGVADKDIRIEGHTDNVPITGELKNKYPSNWELSTARATAVARYLQDNAKVDPLRLVATGYGEYRPVAPNDTPANKALNRRIEIVLVPRD